VTGALDGLQLGWRRARVPLVLQGEAAECGLACLAMIAAAHGHRTDLAELRQRFSISMKGVTLADMVRLADAMQLASRAVRVELDELERLPTPCVLHWDLNHFVVLVGVKRGVAVLHDPARGARRLPLAEVSRHFTGVALELQPAHGFAPRRRTPAPPLSQLLGRVTGIRRTLAQVLALALALEAFALLVPFYLQWVVDGVLVSADRDLLVTLGIGFGLLVVVMAATSAVRSWAVLHVSTTLNLQWLANVFAHLLKLPIGWFEKRHTGDVWSRFASIGTIQQALTTSFVEALIDGMLVVGTLAVMAYYSLQLAAVALLAVGVYLALRAAFHRPLRDATEESIVHEARRSSHFLESLRGVQAIKLHNRQLDRQARFLNLAVETANADAHAKKLTLSFTTLHRLVFGLERVAVLWLGALLVLDAQFSVGMLFAFLAYKEQFSTRVSSLIDKLFELRMLRLHGERLADIVLTAPEQAAVPAARQDIAPSLELRGVAFRYSDAEPPVLEDCSLRVEAGESVAIVGPSGCGKTTLLKLLLGIHAPQAGEVRVGGLPLAELGLGALRDMIGTVMQDDQLFAGSIADNVCFFDPQPDTAWMHECARIAAVADEIDAMPMGWHTLIGDMGASISGGQKQRLLLARALYKRPKILLLDEATSALDLERERAVNHAVRRLDLTRVIVAHRPDTIAMASRVIVLADGGVVQDLRSAGPLRAVDGGKSAG
jgi:ATP-binding cassette subfamily B protein RaxB